MTIGTTSKTATIGTAATLISEAKTPPYSERAAIIITNTSSTQVITLAIGQEAVSLAGIVLYPGGFFSLRKEFGKTIPQSQITAISSAAAGTISIYEEVEHQL